MLLDSLLVRSFLAAALLVCRESLLVYQKRARLPETDNRLPSIVATTDARRRAGLGAVTGVYEGGHWLGRRAL